MHRSKIRGDIGSPCLSPLFAAKKPSVEPFISNVNFGVVIHSITQLMNCVGNFKACNTSRINAYCCGQKVAYCGGFRRAAIKGAAIGN